LTAFPFDYPEATKLQDLQLGYIFFKEQLVKFLSGCPVAFKQKIKIF